VANDNRLDLCRHQQGSWRHRPPQGIRDTELADEWLKENDPEGVAFGCEVIEE